MMFEGHTPGPWAIIGEKDLLEDSINDLMIVAFQVGPDMEDDDIYIVNVGNEGAIACIEENEHSKVDLANARLIAAAPQFLAERKKLIGALGKAGHLLGKIAELTPDSSWEIWDSAMEAIDLVKKQIDAVLAEVKEMEE